MIVLRIGILMVVVLIRQVAGTVIVLHLSYRNFNQRVGFMLRLAYDRSRLVLGLIIFFCSINCVL